MLRAIVSGNEWDSGERDEIIAHLASLGLATDEISGADPLPAVDVLVVRWPLSSESQAHLSDYPPPCLRLLAFPASDEPAAIPPSVDAAFPIRSGGAPLVEVLASLGYVPFSSADEVGIWPALDALTGGDAEILIELVQSLANTNVDDLAALSEACRARDWDQARAMAHRIKGTARMLNCHAVVAVCQAIEAASSRHDGESVSVMTQLLTRAMDRLLGTLSNIPN